MREQQKKRQRIYDFLNTEIKPIVFEITGVSLWPSSSPDFNPLDYAIWSVLENKTNTTFHPNIGSLKTAVEREWNKMSEEFILKACKLFWRWIHIMIKKMVAISSIYCFVSIYFVVLKLKLILFYNKVAYIYTRIFLILLLHPSDSGETLRKGMNPVISK